MTTAWADHVESLAREYRIVLDVRATGTRGRSFVQDRRIRISPVRGDVSYAVALHELGHLIAVGASGRKYRRLDKELRAWRWARAAALEWTPRMDRAMRESMRSYLECARRRSWPVPSDYLDLLKYGAL